MLRVDLADPEDLDVLEGAVLLVDLFVDEGLVVLVDVEGLVVLVDLVTPLLFTLLVEELDLTLVFLGLAAFDNLVVE